MKPLSLHTLTRRSAPLALWLVVTGLAADGVYEPVELRKREPNDLMSTAVQFHDQFERRSLLYGEPNVIALVERIGQDIAPPPSDDYIDYRFYVIRDPSPNAFAMPNGAIYVHTGMLARLDDSSQLAALLAHEVNHVAGHHGILQYRITAKKMLIDIFGGGFASLMTQLRFSRELEQEADDRAPGLLLDTPYDPHAAPELFDLLAEDFEGLQPRIATIWTTHPDPEERADTSRRLVADLPMRQRDQTLFDDVVYPLRAITIRDYIQDDYPYTAIALAAELLERYPDELEFRMLLGDAWQTLGARSEFAPNDFSNKDKRRNLRRRVFKTRQEREQALLETEAGRQAYTNNLNYARETYEELLAINADYAPAYRGLGEVYGKLGLPREAGRNYLEYVRRAPEAADRSIIVGRLAQIRDSLTEEKGNAND
jgi:predicted Zn-dependent protease